MSRLPSEEFYKIGEYEILLDQKLMEAYCTLKTPEYVRKCHPNYAMVPFDNTIWPNGKISMKRVLCGVPPEQDHAIAAHYFAMAARRSNADGLPQMLIKVTMTPECLNRAFLEEISTDSDFVD